MKMLNEQVDATLDKQADAEFAMKMLDEQVDAALDKQDAEFASIAANSAWQHALQLQTAGASKDAVTNTNLYSKLVTLPNLP